MKNISFLILALLSANATAATCTRSNLTGTWFVYAAFESVTRCTLVMSSSGSSISSSSSCTSPDVFTNTTLRGTLNISKDCNLTGQITIGLFSRNVDAYLNTGKNVFSGITWQTGNSFLGSFFNGVKK